MAEKLGVANEQLKISKDEIAILRKELDSKSYKTRELQDQLKATKENLAKLECAKYFRGEIILKC
jgi:septal ring factor EnvC (AmiA/AmiB activator)